MTTNADYDWRVEYRAIPDNPNYVMSPDLDVWRVAGRVRCKGGALRQKAAKRIKHSNDGRVNLSHDGKVRRFHVRNDLYPQVFPDLVERERQEARQRPQATCAKGHPLIKPINPQMFGALARHVRPKVALWGTGNRICLRCCELPDEFAINTYSLHFGISGLAESTRLPAKPRVPANQEELDELEWSRRGFIITQYPWGGSWGES